MAQPKDSKNPDKPFVIPLKFWNQLDEFTNGGWICFYIDDLGQIQLNANFQTEVAEEAIRAWATRYLCSINSASEIAETQGMLGMRNKEEEDEEDES